MSFILWSVAALVGSIVIASLVVWWFELADEFSAGAGIVLGVAGLLVGAYIPIAIQIFATANQRLDRCVDSVLDLREMLSRLYSGPADEFGFVTVATDSPARIEAQNSKDTTFILCTGIDVLGSQNLDVEVHKSWQNAPLSYTEQWSTQSVEELYTWTGDALDVLQDQRFPLE